MIISIRRRKNEKKHKNKRYRALYCWYRWIHSKEKIQNLNDMRTKVFTKKTLGQSLTEEESNFDCSILDEMWSLIEKSKKDCSFDSDKQYKKLVLELSKLEKSKVMEIKNWWREAHSAITSHDEFIKLSDDLDIHGDDSTFMDFGNWLVAQGEELCMNFLRNGSKSVLDYITENNISYSDYTYECMVYAFSKVLDK